MFCCFINLWLNFVALLTVVCVCNNNLLSMFCCLYNLGYILLIPKSLVILRYPHNLLAMFRYIHNLWLCFISSMTFGYVLLFHQPLVMFTCIKRNLGYALLLPLHLAMFCCFDHWLMCIKTDLAHMRQVYNFMKWLQYRYQVSDFFHA